MKLSDFLADVGRPIAYYPGLRQITGSTTATILFCQLMYWTGKEKSGDGWIYKSAEELEDETGMSYDEQKTARAKLIERGLIEEDYKRLEHRMYFRVKLDTLNAVWEIPEHGNAQMGKQAMPDSSNMATPSSLNDLTETTREYKQGEKSPMPIDWKIAHDESIKSTDLHGNGFDYNQARNISQLIDMQCSGAGALALAFMEARRLIFAESQVKGQRKAARDLLVQHVRPEHVRQAVEELTGKRMTITDLYSITKTAIGFAHPVEEHEYNPLGLSV